MKRLAAALRIAVLTLLGLASPGLRAQPTDPAPQLRIEASMAPDPALTAGATSTLQIDVLTTTWFTQPPELPALDIPGARVSGPSGQAALIRRSIDGVNYSGLRFAYLVSPVAAGGLQVPAIRVTAQLGQAAAPLTASSRPLALNAAGPLAGRGDLLAASAVRLTQQVSYSADPPKVGDRISRVVTVEAQGAMAMLIPPPVVATVAGLKAYGADPALSPLSDSRGGFLGGRQVTRIEYVVKQPGAYVLPAVTLRWWNVATAKEEQAALPAVTFTAQAGPAYQGPFSVEQDLRDMGRQVQVRIPGGWLALAAGVALLAVAVALLRPWVRRAWRDLRVRAQAVRQRWRESEPHAAWALRRELAHPQGRLDPLYRWLARIRGADTLAQATAGLAQGLQQPARQALTEGYGRAADSRRAFDTLRQAVPSWRRAWRHKGTKPGAHRLAPLNPRNTHGGGE